ncbi:uracil phosphoribosyltransferase [Cytobacillus sp. FSL W7-1323]|uniref:Uracil phosphoribosyltransferase n=1 Tax=Cytobacillus kochii TaxID=859143 RepID=A0A248TII0_9BACI|nr:MULTISPECIES: uracil phosphoribosyltransferase [Cytobacillus]ASV68014.1 uracil phosphoribosyltransferase [Cytobacillus kochii]MCA1026357.1 uracil phosphoribosyltransferase [Cytobacillus kochii]MCM3322497.1 uracil phosphoribosyltransferase [Cytobacillus kochii]MCM3345025.1 uracil phosphoribosyltransferase [Cytobacillus kochii]MDM5209580.1 uracil phosphoribosyltransferase [Cytobacillus kochii]
MAKVYVFDHPLIQHKLTYIREKNTGTKEFRELVDEVSTLMAFEITRDMPLEEIEIDTPVQKTNSKVLSGKKMGIVPILRAGIGMVDGILKLIPAAKVGHVGLYRDPETLKPVEYYAKFPGDIEERDFIVVDPMLATGGSAIEAINSLKKRGGKSIKFMCLIAAPEGVEALKEAHPDVDIYIAALDEMLNEKGYIVPGLGDAGDRLFGTK